LAKKRFCRRGHPENGETGADLRGRYVRLKNWKNESFFIANPGMALSLSKCCAHPTIWHEKILAAATGIGLHLGKRGIG